MWASEQTGDKLFRLRLSKLLVILGLTVFLSACVTHTLQTGLSEQDAQEIVVLLNENSIDASAIKGVSEKKGEEKWDVVIRGGDQNLARAWRVLEENGLPRQKDKGLEDVFSNSGMIPTATEEKARLLLGISGEISRALKSVAGVVDAHVLVVMPESSPLIDKTDRVPPTASVLVKYRGRDVPLAEEEVKKLVARAVEGLQPENVAVVYKKVELRQGDDRNLLPQLGNQEFLLASLGLLAISSIGCLALVGKSRWQRSKIETLEKQLQSAAQRPASAQLPGTSVPTKAVRMS
jgi:type III secretion protein J